MLLPLAITFVVVLVVGVLAFAASRPGDFRISRSTRISAAPDRILSMIDDFHAWAAWSPWEKIDPSMTRTFGGAASGVGATYEWSGNKKAGAGRMEVLRIDPASRVEIKLDFSKPFVAHNLTEFTLAPDGDATRVTWSMQGQSPFIAKLFGVFVNMDTLVGRDFEAGLATMQANCERAATVPALAAT